MKRAVVALLASVAWAVLLTHPRIAQADVVPIDVVTRGQNRLVIDGVLGDWRRFTELLNVDESAQIVLGQTSWTGPDDAAFAFALARDEQALYFAAEVRDDQVVRSREHRSNDDALVISLGVSVSPTRTVGYDLLVYPGDPGNYGGVVRYRGRRSGTVPGAQVVEAPLRNGSGFTIEVAIPWRAIPEIRDGLATLRGSVAYQDADRHASPTIETVLATGPGDGEHPEALPPAVGSNVTNVAGLIAHFQQSQGLVGTDPFLDRSANIAGDAALERVVVFPRFVVAAGPGIAGGTRYAYVQYPLNRRDDFLETTLRDLTGDGRMDLVLRLRVPDASGLTREVLYVYGAPNGGDSLTRLFAHELGRSQGANRLSNRATYDSGARIRVTFQSAEGYTQDNYPRVVETGVFPPLTPWGEHRVVVYRWNESLQRFEIERTEPNPHASATSSSNVASAPTSSSSSPPMVAAPTPDDVLRLFRQQRGLADNVRPSFSMQGNVAEDRTPESVQIYGRYLVVTGPRFMNGRSFYNIELPVNADSDVLGLELADVTDDGRAEAIVRVRRTSQVQLRGRTVDVVKEFLLIYSIDDAHRGRVFAAEISRRVGNEGITNVVRPIRRGQNAELVIDAGRATGWTAQTYPFRDAPAQGFAPLLLPWDSVRTVRYRWNGTALVSTP